MEARTLSDAIKRDGQVDGVTVKDLGNVLQSLDALGYDEAAQHVYGMHYDDWKKRHARKASDETMQRFNDSKPLWAKHNKEVLAKRADAPTIGRRVNKEVSIAEKESGSKNLLSNVCCQDVDATTQHSVVEKPICNTGTRGDLPLYEPPTPPDISFSLGILTISDRASAGQYVTGDLSGPAVEKAVEEAIDGYGGAVKQVSTITSIVSDELEDIKAQLIEWSDVSRVNLILTTGGTGFSPRDQTPEATNAVVDRVCDGLVSFCTMECAKLQPMASLSRGSAGVRGTTLIVNLPGNPKGVGEIVPILLPLALHAIADLK